MLSDEELIAQWARKDRIGNMMTQWAVGVLVASLAALWLLTTYYEVKRDLWLWRQWRASEQDP